MLNLKQLEEQAKSLAAIVKNYVSSVLSPLEKRLSDLEEKQQKLAAISVADLVEQVIAALPKSMAADEIRTMIEEHYQSSREALLSDAVKQLPTPKDGEPGKSVTLDDVKPLIDQLVNEKFAALPVPQDGKSVDDADVQAMVKTCVDEAIKQLPVPKDGEQGKSVTVDDVKPLIDQLVNEKFAALPVPQDGKSVDKADVQAMVKTCVDEAIKQLPVPKDGEPGRDGLDLDILPAIPQKSVPRGTYALHKGGLWRSYQTTDDMRGWECILDGIADTEINVIDERNYQLRLITSSGAVTEKTFALRHAIHRGVFKAGEYQPGDTVTWGGSLWHCDETTSDKPGEPNSKGWTLAVKRGRDGKDGRNGKDAVQSVKINSGES